ncbi:rho guanine nucleotide exchange factor 9 [Hydra vulgaris]|uniref:rho guanine nucleotide exchange factor 9 n=1 Tax=Hydra vulgaris TaxID=6087 RepID=UPI001F5ECF22|nr:rho guanine nucleotide exchange factor 9 isoform X1 [Hydra vulgaris]XP_047130883.1 rho guanine nucleotide exchange factor 9 isoform X1 [Hydra vulgaris]XP_047130884.1 rho guanine nucleotide exchange factor 9 isoform X1 [Hydra vulgaris]
MMEKKSNGEYDHGPTLTKHGNNIFSAFNSIGKKFRRLKNAHFADYFKADVTTNTELPSENLPNDNKRKNVIKRWSSLSRIKERNEKKNNSKSQINIVQWSSNESVAEPKSKKFNSLKLSRGYTLFPPDYENESPVKAFNANDCSITVENTEKDIENDVCCLDCNETYIVPYEDKLDNEKQSDINNTCCSVLSLQDLSESDGFNEITIEKCNCFATDNNKNIINQTHTDFIDFPLIEIPKTLRTSSFQNIKFQPFEHSKDRYSSTPVLVNRPPLPLVPKPINRRNKALNYNSKENLTSDVSQDFCNLRGKDSNLKRTFSDCLPHKFSSDEYLNKTEGNAISAVIEEEKPKPLLQKKDDKVWRNVSSAMIIAEAVWDHGSMKPDELSFSSGAVIYVLFTDDDNWWWGIHNGVMGWFPVSYVRLRVDQEIDRDSEHFRELHSLKEESLFPSQLCAASNKTLEHMAKVRAKCVEELLNTEKVYVKLLKDIIQGYVMEVDAETRLFTPEDKQILFSNIEELYFFHQVFLADLQKAVNMEWMEKSVVGPVFLKHQSNFEIYSNYCNNQPRSSARLSVLSKEKKINVFFESCRLRQNMIRLSLDGFLLSPVQRICKYPLQIKELIKHTMVDHPDFSQLLEAQACMQNVASLINERKRRLENINKLAMWQLSISNWKDEDLVIKSSMLLQKGTLNKISNNKFIKCSLYLFDHQLIVLRQESQKKPALLYLHRIDLDQAKIEDLADGSVTVNNETVNNIFRVWCEKRQKWYTFSVLNTDLKLLWKSAFIEERRVVNEEIQKGFVVSTEVRAAAMENAYNQYIAERKKIRLKSVSTAHPTELETFKTFTYATMVEPFIHVGTDQVVRRANKKDRSKSFRHSLHGFIFEKLS